MVAQARGTRQAEVTFAEQLVAEAPDLDVTGPSDQNPISLREVLVHMVEEYSRRDQFPRS